MKIELRAKCPTCGAIRTLQAINIDPTNPAACDLAEGRIKPVQAVCPTDGNVEDVAMFLGGKQSEPWSNADEYERQNGPDAGPLPARPWDRLRSN